MCLNLKIQITIDLATTVTLKLQITGFLATTLHSFCDASYHMQAKRHNTTLPVFIKIKLDQFASMSFFMKRIFKYFYHSKRMHEEQVEKVYYDAAGNGIQNHSSSRVVKMIEFKMVIPNYIDLREAQNAKANISQIANTQSNDWILIVDSRDEGK